MSNIEAMESWVKSGGGSSRPGSGPIRYLSYFILGEDESKVVRFLTDMDEVIQTQCYEFVLDKNGKFQNFICAPAYHKNDPSWQGEDWVRKYGGKSRVYNSNELEDPVPRSRALAIAVEREEVASQSGGRRAVSTQDLLTTIEDKNGVSHDARNFLVIKQGTKFWTPLLTYYREFGTLCDRDYKITRSGTGRDIVYSMVPKSPDPDWDIDGDSLKNLQARYGYGTGTDMDGNPITSDSPDRFLYITQTLKEWADNQASEERAKAALVSSDGIEESRPAPSWAGVADDEPQVSSGPDMSSLRARLERHR